MTSTWGASIRGEADSLEGFEKKVNGSVKRPDDFFISMAGETPILRCSRWDAALDPRAARQLAIEDFSVIVGCLDILERRSTLSLHTIFRFNSDGTIDQHAQSVLAVPRKPKADATPGMFKRLVIAASSHYLREAIRDYQSDGDWYGVYKAFEGLKKHYGDENRLFAAFPTKKTELVRLRRTANSYRHTAKAFDQIANPIGLNAAKLLLESIFEVIALAEPYPNSPFPGGQVQIDNYPELPVIWFSEAAGGEQSSR